MLRTKLLAVLGLLLTLSSLLLGVRFWGYPRAVLMLQTGGFALALGLFFRIAGSRDREGEDKSDPIAGLYDMESLVRWHQR